MWVQSQYPLARIECGIEYLGDTVAPNEAFVSFHVGHQSGSAFGVAGKVGRCC